MTTVCGLLGEALPLHKRLEALPSNTKWLSSLDYITKTTVNTAMEECVQARLEDSKELSVYLVVGPEEKVKS